MQFTIKMRFQFATRIGKRGADRERVCFFIKRCAYDCEFSVEAFVRICLRGELNRES